MAYPHKWSPISCRSSAGQGKFAGQRPTFYHCAAPPTVTTAYCNNLLLSLPERRAPASSGERAAGRVHRRPTLLPVRRELTHRRAAPDLDGVCCLHVAVRFYQFDEKTIEKCCANEGVFRQKPPPLPTNKFQRKVHYTRLHARAHTHTRARARLTALCLGLPG